MTTTTALLDAFIARGYWMWLLDVVIGCGYFDAVRDDDIVDISLKQVFLFCGTRAGLG